MAFPATLAGMAEYMVTLVWDTAPGDAENGLGSLDGAWEASSRGKYVTGVPVTAETPSAAYEYAYLAVRPFVSDASPIGFAVEPVSERPHFAFAKPLS